jgi:hypothetical protein
MTARSLKLGGIMVLAVLALSACAGGRFSIVEEEGVSAVVNNDTSSGMDAQVGGTAVIDRGCWAIDVDGDGISPVAWPPGTTITGGRLDIPGIGEPLDLGDAVLLGGGEVPVAGLPLPDRCWSEDDALVLILNG